MLSRRLADGWVQAGSQKAEIIPHSLSFIIIAHIYQVLTVCQTPFQVLDDESSQQRCEVGPIISLSFG